MSDKHICPKEKWTDILSRDTALRYPDSGFDEDEPDSNQTVVGYRTEELVEIKKNSNKNLKKKSKMKGKI